MLFCWCLSSKWAKWESQGLFYYYSHVANGNFFFRLSIKKNIDIQYKNNLYLWCVYKQNTRHKIIKLNSQQKCICYRPFQTVCFDLLSIFHCWQLKVWTFSRSITDHMRAANVYYGLLGFKQAYTAQWYQKINWRRCKITFAPAITSLQI